MENHDRSQETDLATPAGSQEPGSLPPVSTEAEGPHPAAPPPPGIPWEDPELSFPAALGRTLKAVLFRPGEFFHRPARGGWRAPLAFGLLLGTAGLAAALFWHLVSHLWVGHPQGFFALPQVRALANRIIISLMVFSPAIVVANLGVSSLCLWLALIFLGARGGFLPVWRIFAYAQAGMVLGFVPVVGGAVGSLWVLYLTYKGLRAVFALSGPRAAGAVVVSLFLQTLLLGLFVVGLLGLRLFWR